MLLELFLTFAQIGAFTFGGGYAMISIIEDECVEKRKWITSDQLSTITAIAESTPGSMAINCATYTGYMQAGVPGAICATLGVIVPSFLIIYLISRFFDNFLEITVIAKAFKGIKAAVVAPAFFIILLIVTILKRALDNLHVQACLNGIKACMVGIILATGLSMVIENILPQMSAEEISVDVTALMITIILLLNSWIYKKRQKKVISLIMLILTAGVLGTILY